MADDMNSRFANLEVDDGAPARREEPAPTIAPVAPVAPTPAPVSVLRPLGNYPVRPRTPSPAQLDERAINALVEERVRERMRSNELIAVALPGEMTGAVAYWSLAGDTTIDALRAAWEAGGLDPELLPATPSPATALNRAMKDQGSKTRLVRQHPEGGWVLVDEARAGDTLDYTVGLRVRLAEDGKGLRANMAAPELSQIRAAFDRALTKIAAVDVSTWLVKFTSRILQGVALRETGGLYFVPREHVATLRKVKKALAVASAHTLYEIPAMHSVEAIGAVLDAMSREATEELAEMENEIGSADFSPRMVGSRVRRCDEIATKVAGYEKLLGQKLGDVTTRIASLKEKLAKVTTRGALLEVD